MDEVLKRCFRYLGRKMHTVRELSEKLRRDGFEEKAIEEAITFLQEKGYLNDEEYVRVYLESQRNRPKGYLAIVDTLRRKGVELRYLSSLREDFYSLEREVEDALGFLQMKAKPEDDEDRLRKKLLQRGFTWEAVERALQRWRDSACP